MTMVDEPSAHTTAPPRSVQQEARPAAPRWLRWLPGVITLRHYDPAWLRHDIVAGLVMTTMLVPVGIAYAQASGVPGITGSTPPSSRSSRTRCSVPAAFSC